MKYDNPIETLLIGPGKSVGHRREVSWDSLRPRLGRLFFSKQNRDCSLMFTVFQDIGDIVEPSDREFEGSEKFLTSLAQDATCFVPRSFRVLNG